MTSAEQLEFQSLMQSEKEKSELLCAEVEKLLAERNSVRRNRNFARSDEIRDLLLEHGIILEDTPDGVKWKRKKK